MTGKDIYVDSDHPVIILRWLLTVISAASVKNIDIIINVALMAYLLESNFLDVSLLPAFFLPSFFHDDPSCIIRNLSYRTNIFVEILNVTKMNT